MTTAAGGRALDVAELLPPLEVHPDDVYGFVIRVVASADGHDVWGAVRGQPAFAEQIGSVRFR